MATVKRIFGSWTSPGAYFPPGGVHWWTARGFNYGDPVFAAAHPVVGDPSALYRQLQVEQGQVIGKPNGDWYFQFAVRNVGSTSIPGYGVGVGWIEK
jgi:hypothetical protein